MPNMFLCFIGNVIEVSGGIFHAHRLSCIVNADVELSAGGVGKSANGFQNSFSFQVCLNSLF